MFWATTLSSAIVGKMARETFLELENMMIGMAKRDMMDMAYQLAEVNGLIDTYSQQWKKAASTHWYNDVMKCYQ